MINSLIFIAEIVLCRDGSYLFKSYSFRIRFVFLTCIFSFSGIGNLYSPRIICSPIFLTNVCTYVHIYHLSKSRSNNILFVRQTRLAKNSVIHFYLNYLFQTLEKGAIADRPKGFVIIRN